MQMLLGIKGRDLSLVCLSAIFLAALPARAEDLVTLIASATRYDAEFVAATHNFNAAIESPVIAKADLYPRIAAQIDLSETDQDIVRAENPLFSGGRTRYSTNAYEVVVEQPLLNWQSFRRIGQANTELEQARAELWNAKLDLNRRVSEAYFAILAARNGLELVKAEKAVVANYLEQARERHKRGFAAKPDVADAEARLLLVEADEIELGSKLQDSVQALAELSGYRPDSLQDIDENTLLSVPDPNDVEQWVKLALVQNPAIDAKRQAVEAAQQEAGRRAAATYPTLDLVARYGKRDTDGAVFGGQGAEIDTADLLLSLNIPIYQGQRVSAQVRQAAQLLAAAFAEEKQARRSVERQTRAAYNSVQNAIKRSSALLQAVAAQDIALEAKREGFKRGLFSSLDVLDAEKARTEVKIKYQEARYQYLLSLLSLYQARGGMRRNELEIVNGKLTQWVSLPE